MDLFGAYLEGSEAHLGDWRAISDLFGAHLKSLKANLVPIWGAGTPISALLGRCWTYLGRIWEVWRPTLGLFGGLEGPFKAYSEHI